MRPTTISPFLGMNNRLPRTKLRSEDGSFLADAVNVDFHGRGNITARHAARKIYAGTDMHSLWKEYCVKGDALCRVSGSAGAPVVTPVLSGVARGVRMAYTEHAGKELCSDGQNIWVLGDSPYSFGVPVPTALPTISVGVGGLAAGVYQIAIRNVRSNGEYSGATLPVVVEVGEGTSLIISWEVPAAGLVTEVFVSPRNSLEMYSHGISSGTSSVVTMTAVQGANCDSLHKTPLPPGNILASFGGRVLVAAGNAIHYTDPWSAFYDPRYNFIPFAEPVTMCRPCGNAGVFVSADATYWLSGDLVGEGTRLVRVLPYRAVAGTDVQRPDSGVVQWMSERGFVIGTPDGIAENIQEKNVAVLPALVGAAQYREHNGLKQLVATTFSPGSSSLATGTYAEAEVIHRTPI